MTTPPSAPIDLDVPIVAMGKVQIEWQPGSGKVPNSYDIYRSDDSSPSSFTKLASVSGNTQYIDTSVTAGQRYYYEVMAVGDSGEDDGTTGGVAMALVPAVTTPASPGPLIARPDGDGIDLTWRLFTCVRMRIDRASGNGLFVAIAYVGADTVQFHDSYVNAGTNYTYRIVAQNTAGSSAPSNSATTTAPAAAAGETGMPPLPEDVVGTALSDGEWVGGFYADGEVAAGVNDRGPSSYVDISQAQQMIDNDGYTQTIQVVPAPDGIHAIFHVYSNSMFGGQKYLGAIPFVPTAKLGLEADLAERLELAESASREGTLITAASTTAQVIGLGTTVAATLIPGPDDVVLGAFIEKAVAILGRAGVKASYKAGKWIFEKAGRVLVKDAAKDEMDALRTGVIAQIGSSDLKWTSHGDKHIVKGNISWSDVVKSTKHGGAAKYLPSVSSELLERYAWVNGTPVTNGKNWKVMAFDHVIGACDGVEVYWMRVESSGGTIHGHPITLQKYRGYLK